MELLRLDTYPEAAYQICTVVFKDMPIEIEALNIKNPDFVQYFVPEGGVHLHTYDNNACIRLVVFTLSLTSALRRISLILRMMLQLNRWT